MLILKEYLLSNVGDIRSKWKNVPYPYFLVNKENKIKYVNDLTNICDSWVSILRKIMVKKKKGYFENYNISNDYNKYFNLLFCY